MANIEVQSKSDDKRCRRCVDFVAKCDRYALHNSNLITDLEKFSELIVVLSRADKEHRSQVLALKIDISEFERRLAQVTIKIQDLKVQLETCQNTVLERNQLILDKDNLILDLQRKLEKFESSSDVMNFCINNLRLKDSEDEMFGVGYKKVPPPINHNYASTPSIDPEIADFVPTAPLTVDPLSEEESESVSESE
ncbi:hypothetical protein Hanom_Chr05g00396451 [Helianthus anomalus]